MYFLFYLGLAASC